MCNLMLLLFNKLLFFFPRSTYDTAIKNHMKFVEYRN